MHVCTEDSLYLLDGKVRQHVVSHPNVAGSQAREAAEPGLALSSEVFTCHWGLWNLKARRSCVCSCTEFLPVQVWEGQAQEESLRLRRPARRSQHTQVASRGREIFKSLCSRLDSSLTSSPAIIAKYQGLSGLKIDPCLPGTPWQASRALR